MTHPIAHARRGHPAGFALISVLIAVGVMAGLVAAYGRHVVVEGRAGLASPSLLQSRETCHSGLQYARQALVSGETISAGSVSTDACSADYQVVELSEGRLGIQVQALGTDGFGSRRVAEVELSPTAVSAPEGPASLPTLDSQTVEGLLADSSLPVTSFTESQRLEQMDLSGLLVVYPGVELELDDVVISGSIVSATVMGQGDLGEYDEQAAPRVIIDGNVRIDPLPSFPGVAILLPDGAIEGDAIEARIQIHGDVVAHDLSLLNPGALEGHAMGVNVQLADESQLDRLGYDRKDIEWSPDLQLGGTQKPVFMATIPASTSLSELSPIIDFWNQG